jgi:hypothetical protein
VYSTIIAEITIIDLQGRRETYLLLFIIIDLKKYLIYLSLL